MIVILLVNVFIGFAIPLIVQTTAFAQAGASVAASNPFIGKWEGEWIMLRTTKSYVIGYGPKAELVVKENGMLESLYGKGERAEYPYLINGDVLSFTTHLGKVLEFKLTEEGKLKGVYKDYNWYCVLDRVP